MLQCKIIIKEILLQAVIWFIIRSIATRTR